MVSVFVFRLRFLYLILIVVGLTLLGRLFLLQVVQGEIYEARAAQQYGRAPAVTNDRGAIYFETKDGQPVFAATVKEGFLVEIRPSQIRDAEETYRRLSRVAPDLDREVFLRRAESGDNSYFRVLRRLAPETAAAIRNLNLSGVFVSPDRWRFYPAGRLAAHLLGLVSYEGNQIIGRYGLERSYNQVLARRSEKTFTSFLAEAFGALGGAVFGGDHAATSTEANLILAVEPTVEESLEQELKMAIEKTQAEAGGGLVIEPVTGAIRAMAAWPNFDPGGTQGDLAVLPNPLVENVFEMGSIVKPLTMAAGIDAGVITPETTYVDSGFVVVDNRRIENYDGKGRGAVSMQEVLNQSLNTGAVFVMERLGKELFREYFLNYGLGEKTGVDLPGEVNGLVGPLDSPRKVEYATAAFGQGIAVTPIAIARSLSVLANGGKLIKPYVVSGFENPKTGLVQRITPAAADQVLKPETTETITRMLVKTVDEALAGGRYKLTNYSVAAKTGTAQMINPAGGYYEDRYLHSFFGYFPAYESRFLVFLYLIHPRGFRYASETLTEPFMNLTKFLLGYYQISPDR